MPIQYTPNYLASVLLSLAIWWVAMPTNGYAQRATLKKAKPALACLDATKKTRALYGNMKKSANTSIMFGHQDDLAYGVGWKGQGGVSDVKQTSGDYPAVYGWDLGHLGQSKTSMGCLLITCVTG